MTSLDAIDYKILAKLQSDGRMTNADLAGAIHLSPSACLRRVKRLEEEGVIDGYAMLVNQAKIGKPTNVFVEITLEGQSEEVLDRFEEAVSSVANVMECYLMSGNADYLLRVAVADASDYERVHKLYLSRLPGVSRIRSSFALRRIGNRVLFELE